MYHIAIVEDEKDFSAQLVEYLDQYKKEHGVEFQVSVFSDGESILKDYQSAYDAVFLDIQLPGINGMRTAEVIRGMDEEVVLMFITNMAQYAISGYAVEALEILGAPESLLVVGKRICSFHEKKGSICASGRLLSSDHSGVFFAFPLRVLGWKPDGVYQCDRSLCDFRKCAGQCY